MGESCQHKALCSCCNASEIRDYVKNKIESCIQKYLSLEETANYLQENYQISSDLTESIWEQLQRESPEFFRNYYLRCRIARQTKMHNDLLVKQVSLMIEHGHLDICGASPAIGTFLQHPEGSRLLEKLATASSYKTKASFASLALPDANSPSVTQLQIPNDPQNQLHQWSTSNDLAYNYLIAPTIAPATTGPTVTRSQIPNDPQNLLRDYYPWATSNDLAYNNLGGPPIAPATTGPTVTQSQIPNDQQNLLRDYYPWATSNDLAYDHPGAQWSSYNDLSYTGDQTVAQVATMQEYPSTFELGGDIGEYELSFEDTDMELLEQLVMQSNEQLYDIDGEYQQQSQVQQNFSVETQQTVQYGGVGNELRYGGSNGMHYGGGSNKVLQYGGGSNMMQYGGSNGMHYGGDSSNVLQYGGGSNGVQYGESLDQQLGYTSQSMQMYTSVDQQQARGVKRHHPESEALNNPGCGDETLTTAQNQYDLQWQGQRQGP